MGQEMERSEFEAPSRNQLRTSTIGLCIMGRKHVITQPRLRIQKDKQKITPDFHKDRQTQYRVTK